MSKFNNILIFAIGFLIELLGSSGVELCADIPFDKNGVSKKRREIRKEKGRGKDKDKRTKNVKERKRKRQKEKEEEKEDEKEEEKGKEQEKEKEGKGRGRGKGQKKRKRKQARFTRKSNATMIVDFNNEQCVP